MLYAQVLTKLRAFGETPAQLHFPVWADTTFVSRTFNICEWEEFDL
jgi:hypothetical protein